MASLILTGPIRDILSWTIYPQQGVHCHLVVVSLLMFIAQLTIVSNQHTPIINPTVFESYKPTNHEHQD